MERFSWRWFSYHLLHNRLVRWIKSRHFITLYMISDNGQLEDHIQGDYHLNDSRDIRCFQETERWHDYDDFIAAAEAKSTARGDYVTYVNNGVLAYFCFIGFEAPQSRFNHVGQTVKYPVHTAVYYSAYTHPSYRNRGLAQNAAIFVARRALVDKKQARLMAAVEDHNSAAHRFHAAAGFEKIARLTTSCLLGRYKFEMQNIDNALAVHLVAGEEGEWVLERKI